jgi:hypothetical protein
VVACRDHFGVGTKTLALLDGKNDVLVVVVVETALVDEIGSRCAGVA